MAPFLMTCIGFGSVAKQNKYKISQLLNQKKSLMRQISGNYVGTHCFFRKERGILENLENVTFEKYKIIVNFM